MKQDWCSRCGCPTFHKAHANVAECLEALRAERRSLLDQLESARNRIALLENEQ